MTEQDNLKRVQQMEDSIERHKKKLAQSTSERGQEFLKYAISLLEEGVRLVKEMLQ